jgi:hypothetical protein
MGGEESKQEKGATIPAVAVVACFFVILFGVTESPYPAGGRFDTTGLVLVSLALLAITGGLSLLRLGGVGDALAWGVLAVGALLLVTCLGVVLSSRPAFGELLGQAEAVSKATLAGVLLHVLAHGAEAPGPRGLRARLIDLAATGAGAVVPLALLHLGAAGHPAHAAGHPASPAGLAFGDALLELILESAPSLLLGLGLGALLQAVELKLPASWFAGGRLAQALRGALVGAPLPICACGILPVSEGLWRRGAGPPRGGGARRRHCPVLPTHQAGTQPTATASGSDTGSDWHCDWQWQPPSRGGS